MSRALVVVLLLSVAAVGCAKTITKEETCYSPNCNVCVEDGKITYEEGRCYEKEKYTCDGDKVMRATYTENGCQGTKRDEDISCQEGSASYAKLEGDHFYYLCDSSCALCRGNQSSLDRNNTCQNVNSTASTHSYRATTANMITVWEHRNCTGAILLRGTFAGSQCVKVSKHHKWTCSPGTSGASSATGVVAFTLLLLAVVSTAIN